jgi:DNA (cytosine-5)-methyltransferase 1
LWPEFRRLITDRKPSTIFGEQVASKAGREWLSGVRADVEELGYAVGAADLCAAGKGAPHIRQRLYWVADANIASVYKWPSGGKQSVRDEMHGGVEGMGDTTGQGLQRQWREYCPSGEGCSGLVGLAMQVGVPSWNGQTIAVKCSDGARRISAESKSFPMAHGIPNRMGQLRGYGNAIVPQVAFEFIKAFMEEMGWVNTEKNIQGNGKKWKWGESF